jgi:hypothetical protein
VKSASQTLAEQLHRADCDRAALQRDALQSATAADAVKVEVKGLEQRVADLDADCVVLRKQVCQQSSCMGGSCCRQIWKADKCTTKALVKTCFA